MSKINHQPNGYHTVTPYLTLEDAPGFIKFVEQAFGATEYERVHRNDGRIMHAEVRIGDSPVMISEACDQMGPMPTSLYLYVDDADSVYRRALDAGATSVMEPADMFWGDRFGSVKDTWGNQWSIASHIEDVPSDELEKRARAFAAQMAAEGGK